MSCRTARMPTAAVTRLPWLSAGDVPWLALTAELGPRAAVDGLLVPLIHTSRGAWQKPVALPCTISVMNRYQAAGLWLTLDTGELQVCLVDARGINPGNRRFLYCADIDSI